MSRLDETLVAMSGHEASPIVLLAHSLGCHLVSAWAAHSRHTGLVGGAWLVAPPDLDGEPNEASLAPQLHSWRNVVRQHLPFPAALLASRNDPYAPFSRSRMLADDWGAAFEDAGEAGHVNADSGYGDWADGWARLAKRLPSW